MLGKPSPMPVWYQIHSLWVVMNKKLSMTFPHVAVLPFLALFLSSVEESELLLPVHTTAGGLSFLQEDGQEQRQRKRSYSILWEWWAWQSLPEPILHPAIIIKSRRKGAVLCRCYPSFPFPMVASGCFCLSQNYDVYHHEGPLVTATVSTKRGRNVVVGTRKAIFPPSSVHRAFISWIWTFFVAHSSDGKSVEGIVENSFSTDPNQVALTRTCCKSWQWSLGW